MKGITFALPRKTSIPVSLQRLSITQLRHNHRKYRIEKHTHKHRVIAEKRKYDLFPIWLDMTSQTDMLQNLFLFLYPVFLLFHEMFHIRKERTG